MLRRRSRWSVHPCRAHGPLGSIQWSPCENAPSKRSSPAVSIPSGWWGVNVIVSCSGDAAVARVQRNLDRASSTGREHPLAAWERSGWPTPDRSAGSRHRRRRATGRSRCIRVAGRSVAARPSCALGAAGSNSGPPRWSAQIVDRVHRDHEGRGLGAGLLRDVIARVAALSEQIGCRGLLVHCESEQATRFHVHLVPEFESSPTDELHVVLLLKDTKRTLRHGSR
jgi:hypothetical protein